MHPKVSEQEVVERLYQVFREQGFDGASLNELAKATGLKKASLYHRFPGGKQEMAAAVMGYVADWNETNVSAIFYSDLTPEKKLNTVLQNLDELYAGGTNKCILRSFSVGLESAFLHPSVKTTFENLLIGFEQLALQFGHQPETAKNIGRKAVVNLHGGLILSQVTEDASYFQDSLEGIRKSFLKA